MVDLQPGRLSYQKVRIKTSGFTSLLAALTRVSAEMVLQKQLHLLKDLLESRN
jgi:hypothetical protein